MKKYYELWNIPWTYEEDEINLIISDECYIYEIGEKSIFFCGNEKEILTIGQIIIEVGNSLYTRRDSFINLLKKYRVKYTIPCTNFVKECFYDLMNLGLSQLVAHAVVDNILMVFKKNYTFKTAYIEKSTNLDEWLKYPLNKMIVFLFESLDPVYIMSKEYTPFNSVFKTHIVECENKLVSVCTELDLHSLINLDALYSRKNNLGIMQCEHCKLFFIKSRENNTKWCEKCRSIDYGERSDEFYKLYRKGQKAMLQRSYRRPDIETWKYQEDYTTPWEKDITNVIENFRLNNDLPGFEIYIKESMLKYKPPKRKKRQT